MAVAVGEPLEISGGIRAHAAAAAAAAALTCSFNTAFLTALIHAALMHLDRRAGSRLYHDKCGGGGRGVIHREQAGRNDF